MPFKQLGAVAAGYQNPITPGGPELVAARYGQSLLAVDHTANTRGFIGVLPAGCLPVTMYISVPVALGAGFTASIGLAAADGDISVAADDGGAAWVTGDTTGAAGGYLQVNPSAFAKVVPKDYDRRLVLKVVTPGTGTPAGQFNVNLVYGNA